MKTWIIVAVIALMIIAVIGVGMALAKDAPSTANSKSTTTKSCGSCSGSCSAESNCRLATCGASNGRTCSCGKKA